MNWFTISLIMLGVSILFGGAMVKVKGKKQEAPVKVMLFVLYFWLSAFIQIALAALGYYLYGLR